MTATHETSGLEIHVLGAGNGESIILRLPGDRWGVVDSYSPSLSDPAKNPTLQFLKERDVGRLEFLCLTHPHEDHFRGMSQLLANLQVREFWRFVGLSGKHFYLLADYLAIDAERRDAEAEIESADELVNIFRLVRENRIPTKRIVSRQQLYPSSLDLKAPLQIWSLAPSGEQITRYENGLAACFGADGLVRGRIPHSHHNMVSAGLSIRFGETHVVLGGDVEAAAWNDAQAEFVQDWFAADAVKVSHHGSTNGYTENLWQMFAGSSKPIAIVTPYRRFRLPDPAALEEIGRNTSAVFTTFLPALSEPIFSEQAPLRSRLVVWKRLKDAWAESTTPACGRCRFLFDNQGNCVEQNLTEPAAEITATGST